MQPTNAEIIFYVITAVIAALLLLKIMVLPSNTMEITNGQRRDWERAERQWNR